jgi:hypothetical protein
LCEWAFAEFKSLVDQRDFHGSMFSVKHKKRRAAKWRVFSRPYPSVTLRSLYSTSAQEEIHS